MYTSLFAALADSAIPLLGGGIATVYGWHHAGEATRARRLFGYLGPVLLAYGLVVLTQSLLEDHTSGAEGRAMFVAAANARAGESVDEETRLGSVTDAGTHIRFDYQLIRLTQAQVDPTALQRALGQTMTSYLCANKTPRQALKAWGPFQMRYTDAQGVPVTVLSMTEDDCP